MFSFSKLPKTDVKTPKQRNTVFGNFETKPSLFTISYKYQFDSPDTIVIFKNIKIIIKHTTNTSKHDTMLI